MIDQKYRMNFLRLKRSWFTYKCIVAALVGWFALIVLIGGVQHMRSFYARYAIEKRRARVEVLNKEKDKQIEFARIAGVRKVGQTAQEVLYNLFMSAPRWSDVLKQLAASVPKQLLLKAVSIDEGAGGLLHMSIEGVGTSARAVTVFVMRLEDSKAFRDVELISTEWQADAHQFGFNVVATVMPRRVR